MTTLKRGNMTQKNRYRLTPDAQADLIQIRRFTVEQWGKAQSRDYLSKLRLTMGILSEHPKLGTKRPELGLGIASFPIASHVIYYVPDEKEIVFFAVLHKSMVPAMHLESRKPL